MQHTFNLIRGATRLVVSVCVALLSVAGIPWFAAAAPRAATSPTLGAAASYSVLGGQTVTNAGPTTMSGDLGVSPGSAITGFPPGIVNPPGMIHAGDANAAAAQVANTAAFTFLDQACTLTYAGVKDLVGENLVPGVYCATAFRLSGTLTLSGSGVWIFKSASDLITSGSANIVGGNPCDVWWRVVSSATLGTNTSLIGSILASTSMSLQTGASLDGRALAQTGAVTLDSNAVTGPVCALANTPIPTATDTPIPTATDTPIPIVTATLVLTAAATLVPTATATLAPAATDTPVLAATATLVPAPTNTRRPSRNNTPVPAETPAPESAETPTPESAETPTPESTVTITPELVMTITPELVMTITPELVVTITPELVVTVTATITTPPAGRLPRTAGDPPWREAFLWGALLVAWVVGALVFSLSIRARRRERQGRR